MLLRSSLTIVTNSYLSVLRGVYLVLLKFLIMILQPLVVTMVMNHYNKTSTDPALVSALQAALGKVEKSVLTAEPSLHPIFWASIFPLVTSKAIKGILFIMSMISVLYFFNLTLTHVS